MFGGVIADALDVLCAKQEMRAGGDVCAGSSIM